MDTHDPQRPESQARSRDDTGEARALERFTGLARSLAACRDQQSLAALIERETPAILGRGHASLRLTGAGGCLVTSGKERGPADSLAREALDSGAPSAEDSGAQARACAPVMAPDHALGVLTVTDPGAAAFSRADLDMLAAVAALASPPLENVLLYDRLRRVMDTIDKLNQLNDVHAILDRILLEARRLANADAGSVFLAQDGRLAFSYVHNDTLFGMSGGNREIYTDLTLPMDSSSLVGHVASTGETLAIDDAYALPENAPYAFNSSLDEKSGYRTVSMLILPLTTFSGKLLGVMQLINAKDHEGRPMPFSQESRASVPMFANHAAVAIERGLVTREQVLRMIRMAELRDPAETGAHVMRVGAYSAELYQRWAVNSGVDSQARRRARDLVGVAAMLHDVGKVGISDSILKKPGKLDDEEFRVMQGHTILGARLFAGQVSALDAMCADIALNHHEKFNGTGYPGHVDDVTASEANRGEPKRGEEISIAARVTALADVFDALSSRRVYKDAWNEQRVFNLIYEERGKHFDPDVVDAFFQITDVLRAIGAKYGAQYQG